MKSASYPWLDGVSSAATIIIIIIFNILSLATGYIFLVFSQRAYLWTIIIVHQQTRVLKYQIHVQIGRC